MFQVAILADAVNSYVIYMYQCPTQLSPYDTDSGFVPDPISATIGVSVAGMDPQIFRYSDTDYAVELRCINRIEDSTIAYNWYNLLYKLTDANLFGSSGDDTGVYK